MGRKLAGRGVITRLLVAVVALGLLVAGEADAQSRSSGGYSRPSPSYRSPAPVPQLKLAPQPRPQTNFPSGGGASGGYSRPQSGPQTAPQSAIPQFMPRSAGDRAVSRQNSGSSLRDYRAAQEQSRFRGADQAAPASGVYGQTPRFSNSESYYNARNNHYGGLGWSPPPYAYQTRSSFGMFDALFLWWMLDSLGNAGHGSWFHNNQNDPAYREWRAEADKMAADNAELRTKLDRLDADLKGRQGQPVDPNYVPPDVKPELALAVGNAVAADNGNDPVSGNSGAEDRVMNHANAADSDGDGWRSGLVMLLAGAGAIYVMRLWRRRRV